MFKTSELKRLEELYTKSGNQLVLLYGAMDCQKEELLQELMKDKKFFYYRARKASAMEQLAMMGEEISSKFNWIAKEFPLK